MDDLNKIQVLKESFESELAGGQTSAAQLLKDKRLKELFESLRDCPLEQRQSYGRALNELKDFLTRQASGEGVGSEAVSNAYLDVTAPWDLNQSAAPKLLDPEVGSSHPIFQTQTELVEVFARMGFAALESRQLDSEFYMFDSLNFPKQHPARDTFDNFLLAEKDSVGQPLLAPAHTSTMQNRVLRSFKVTHLQRGLPIAVVVPGRAFRNEDVDARHDHTFYQLEGIYVDKGVTLANLIATLKEALSAYFKQEIQLKLQPSYFPFTEPSLEFAVSCPFCASQKETCRVCGGSAWIELIGCGMIHPRVLEMADIDASLYSGFAWGLGLNRLTMLKHSIEDIRHFTSGKLEFLRQFGL